MTNGNVCDHARNDMHTHAMSLLKKQRTEASGLGPAAYAPIAKAFSNLPEKERVRQRRSLLSRSIQRYVNWRLVSVFVLVPRIETICLPGSSCTTLLRQNAAVNY